MKRTFFLFYVIIIAVLLAGCSRKKISLSDYITAEYDGYSGFTNMTVKFDKEGFKKALTDNKILKEADAEAFVNSIEIKDVKEFIKNGDTVELLIDYNDDIIKKKKVDMKISIPVTGLKEPVEYDAFAEITVRITGVSPKIKLEVVNNSQDEYLKTLEIKVSHEGFLKIGDKVKVSIAVDEEKEGRLGKSFKALSKEFVVGETNYYPLDASELDIDILKSINQTNIDTIRKETEKTTKKMMWRLTGNNEYLISDKAEYAEGVELVKALYLIEKDYVEGRNCNYIYFVYKAEITNGDTKAEGYFVFEYKNAIVVNKILKIATNNPEDRYVCKTDYDAIYAEYIGVKEEQYYLKEILIKN